MKQNFTRISIFSKAGIACLMLLIPVFASYAQSRATLLEEHFNGTTMPSGWSILGLGTSNWKVSASQKAGGSPNEMLLEYNPSFNGISRLAMPAIDLTGISSIAVSFKHFLDNYSGSHTLGIATSSDNGITWNSGWSQVYSNNGQYSEVHSITTADMNKPNVIVCIYYSGNSYNINNWYFDDIKVFTLDPRDVAVSNIICDPIMAAGSIPIKFEVLNMGVTAITSIKAQYQINQEAPVVQDFANINIASLATKQLEFTTPVNFTPGSYTLTVKVLQSNGTPEVNTSNDSLAVSISVATQQVQRTVMIEQFSSSTCGPCVAPNVAMGNLYNSNPGKFCVVKYQMNWPGSGDIYYTAEGGVRRLYYGISAVPAIMTEGGSVTGVLTQAQLDALYANPAFIDIAGSFKVEGTKVKANFTITPHISMASGVKVHVVVSEKTTTGNVGSNGETSFHHVMMKMIPNANGTDTSFVAGVAQTYNLEQEMTGTHVEQYSDLEVAVFVQQHSTKYIYNSKFLDEYCIPKNLTVTGNAVSVDNISANVEWQAPAGGVATGFNVFYGDSQIATLAGDVNTYTHSGLAIGQHCYKVQSVCSEFSGLPTTPVCVTFTCTAPSALTATADGTTVNLKWKKASNLTTSYNVYRNGEVFAQNITDTTFANANLEPGAYKYKVNAACGTSVSGFSNEVTVKVGCIAPAGFKLTPVGNNKIRLDWDASPTANKYNVYNGDNLIAEAISARTFTHSNLTAGSYCYRVKSICDGNVLSEPTNELCHTITGIAEMYSSTKVYPNPASTQVQIEGNSMKRVLVYDVVGRLVDSRQLDNAASCLIETGAYQAGIYMFCIEFADGGELVKRIAIAH